MSIMILDSDVMITAKNLYYAFDICPGFWDYLLRGHEEGAIFSIDRVCFELLNGTEEDSLVRWVEDQVPSAFFLTSQNQDIARAFGEVMLWVQRSTQFTDQAKARFASGADGWLVAHAMTGDHIVVTNEQPRPEAKAQIKLPDVYNQFGVTFKHTFELLREVPGRFVLS